MSNLKSGQKAVLLRSAKEICNCILNVCVKDFDQERQVTTQLGSTVLCVIVRITMSSCFPTPLFHESVSSRLGLLEIVRLEAWISGILLRHLSRTQLDTHSAAKIFPVIGADLQVTMELKKSSLTCQRDWVQQSFSF